MMTLQEIVWAKWVDEHPESVTTKEREEAERIIGESVRLTLLAFKRAAEEASE